MWQWIGRRDRNGLPFCGKPCARDRDSSTLTEVAETPLFSLNLKGLNLKPF